MYGDKDRSIRSKAPGEIGNDSVHARASLSREDSYADHGAGVVHVARNNRQILGQTGDNVHETILGNEVKLTG